MDRVEIPTNFTTSSSEPTVVDQHNPTIKAVLQGQQVNNCIIDGSSRLNVSNKAMCSHLGITEWEACPFWLRMVDTHSVRPLGLVRKLRIVIGGHTFEISTVVLALDTLEAYPILLGRPWLLSSNMKQNWQHNYISFRRDRSKVQVPTQEKPPPPRKQ